MSLAIYTSAAWLANGGLQVADNATIEVRRESDGALASIFSDREGSVPITNPSAFGDAFGRFEFFVSGGAYRVRVSQDGQEYTLRYQAIGRAQEFDLEQIQTAVNQGVYATTADGITATSDGEFFWVPDGDSLILYRNDAGSAVEILSTPNAGDVEAAIGAANQARDAATTARFIFDDTADGLANTEDGEYFTAPDDGRLVLYKNSAGTAEEVLRYSSSIDDDLIDSHSAETGGVHGIPVGESAEWQTQAQGRVDNHSTETGGIHGIPEGERALHTGDDLPTGTTIGGYVFVQSNLTGAEAPDPETHILLTAGEDGEGEYNEGKLTNESVSGSAPLVVATAEIADAESPMNGQTVQLVNTENRYLMPGTSPGSVAFDQMQQITGEFVGPRDGGTTSDTQTGAFSNIGVTTNILISTDSNVGQRIVAFDSAESPDARTGDHTSPKHIEVTVYMRIK